MRMVAQKVAWLTRYRLESSSASSGVMGLGELGSDMGGSTFQPVGIGSPGGSVEDMTREIYNNAAETRGPPSSPVRIPSSCAFLSVSGQ